MTQTGQRNLQRCLQGTSGKAFSSLIKGMVGTGSGLSSSSLLENSVGILRP